jgi:pimeloyl-ACP methyl ester carboxylesterase
MRTLKIYKLLIFLFLGNLLFAQETKFFEKEVFIPTKTETIQGNLINPYNTDNPDLVILIPGSGPTDRDGNNATLKNNSLKFLAEDLAKNGIATYRYDKSVLTFGADAQNKVEALTLDTFVNEAIAVITFFKNEQTYRNIVIAGHSQGSLVGMVAAQGNADGFISLEGAGRPLAEVLVEQIEKQAPFLKEETQRVLSELEKGNTVDEFDPNLMALFNKSIQPFLISWMKYDPQTEISKLQMPVLIINGSNDMQVNTIDAELLHNAKPQAAMHIIENMNHLFKEIKGDRNENMASYTNPDLPVMPELVAIITTFVSSI